MATGGSLLLVEDDDSIGKLVKQYLEQQDGWRVVWRRTGEEAIAELRGQPMRLPPGTCRPDPLLHCW